MLRSQLKDCHCLLKQQSCHFEAPAVARELTAVAAAAAGKPRKRSRARGRSVHGEVNQKCCIVLVYGLATQRCSTQQHNDEQDREEADAHLSQGDSRAEQRGAKRTSEREERWNRGKKRETGLNLANVSAAVGWRNLPDHGLFECVKGESSRGWKEEYLLWSSQCLFETDPLAAVNVCRVCLQSFAIRRFTAC